MVPSRQNYADWKEVKGLGLVGDASFFPHMNDQWKALVGEKTGEQRDEGRVYCLRDEDTCCVEGKHQRTTILSASLTPAQ